MLTINAVFQHFYTFVFEKYAGLPEPNATSISTTCSSAYNHLVATTPSGNNHVKHHDNFVMKLFLFMRILKFDSSVK